MPLIQGLSLNNFTAFNELHWKPLGQLNVIIGVNDTGKTHLLKLLYSISRSVEEYTKKKLKNLPLQPGEISSSALILRNKLLSTFLPKPAGLESELGSLVNYNQAVSKVTVDLIYPENGLKFEIERSSFETSYSEGFEEPEIQATYIPTKEIFSIFDAIVETREGTKELEAFDDTYYDLVRDYRLPNAREPKLPDYLLNRFDTVTGKGRIEYIDNELWFVRDQQRFGMHQIAEGIRKISIFDRLLRNQRLRLDKPISVLFLNEPETSLHPEAIILFAELLHDLAQAGIQVFLTTHSYFFIKRLEQLSKQYQTDYTLLDLRRDDIGQIESRQTFLKDGLTDNPIIEQSLRLYQNDVELVLGAE